MRRCAVWLAAALSGCAALAYEICWSRALVVPLGNAGDAAAIVLAGFMLGIGVGAWFAGQLAERLRSPLAGYALVELALAGYALVAPWLLAAATHVSSPMARYAIALSAIALPGLAMGASLPLLTRALTSERAPLSHHIAILYAANTAGAALGACVTGFWAIATFGVRQSSYGAAALSAAAALVAWLAAEPRARDVARPSERAPLGDRRRALVAAGCIGAAMLACEVAWARVLTFVFGHDTYAFATLLATVLLGLAIGGALHRPLAERDQRGLLGSTMALLSLAIIASFWFASQLVIDGGRDPFGVHARLATSPWIELYRELTFTPLLVLLPALFAGAAFPCACSLYAGRARDSGRAVGTVALVNGVGAAVGALAAALGLFGVAGLQVGVVLIALGCAAVASWIMLGRSRWSLLAFAGAWALAIAMPRDLPRDMLLATHGARHWRLLFYEEGRTGTVSVIESRINGERQLLMNGINEVTTRLVHDQSFKLLGHLAPLLHPEPRSGLMICLGAGLSAGSALTHPLQELDVVDLSDTVARGARYFAAENNGVLDDPRLRIHIGDGRRFLLDTRKRYDVAIVDSTHPKAVDSWILYTLEFYQRLRATLAPGGIAVQWLPIHGLSERELKIIVRTFLEAFPDMSLWANVGVETYGHVAYVKMVGGADGPVALEPTAIARRLATPRVHADLARYGIGSIEELLDAYLADAPVVREWTEGLPVQRDDHPIVPYTTAYSGGRSMTPTLLLAVRTPPLLQSDAMRAAHDAQGFVLAGQLERAAARFPDGEKIRLYREQRRSSVPFYRALAAMAPDDVDQLFAAGTQLAVLGFADEALAIYRRALAIAPEDFRLRFNVALLYLAAGDSARALDLLRALRSEAPRSSIVLYNLGAALLSAGEASAAIVHLDDALARDPASVSTALTLARAQLAANDRAAAEAVLRDVIGDNRWVAEAHDLLGALALADGDPALAAQHQQRAIALHPYELDYHHRLARARLASADPHGAIAALEAALDIEPEHAASLDALGLAHAELGDVERAAELHLRALEADPAHAPAALNLGKALGAGGRREQAVGAVCLALRLDPSSTAARAELARLGMRCEEL